ncbi:hypothetical protein APSETT445_003127 [Aspergillus pseudonomiae]
MRAFLDRLKVQHGRKEPARSTFLPFTPKPTNLKPGLITSDGSPSTLMSDRGYDSDAQFMDPARYANDGSERPYNCPSIWGSVSPLAQPYYETEPDDPGEELVGESSMLVDGPFSGQSEMERPHLPWHPRDYPHWGPFPPITHSADHERARKRVFSLPESVREAMKNPYAGSPSLNPSGQSQETAGASPNTPTAASPCDTSGRAQQSTSPGPCEADPLVAPPKADLQSTASMAASSSRQVSVGWMSGGRRLGYGYTLVSADDKGDNLSPEDTCSLKTCDLNSASTIGKGHGKRSASAVDKSCTEQDNKTGSGKGLPIFDFMTHRLNLHHWPGATTSSGANQVDEGSSNTSVTSLLWEKFGFLRKSQNEPDTHVDQKPPWSHFCGVGLDQALDGTLTPHRDTTPPVNDEDGQLSKGRTGLHRARSLWTKGRTVTDRALCLETKLTTKIPLSIKQNPGLRREKTRVIKLKNRDRKKTINNSLDEEKPIFPGPKQHELSAISRVEESHGPSTGNHERRDGTLQGTERNSSDTDLADAYEDCLEVHPIPD